MEIAKDVAYRYVDVGTSSIDEWDEVVSTGTKIYLEAYTIISHTPKGFWIRYFLRRRFVLNTARKRFACLTIEDARESYIARKKAQARIYKARLHIAEKILAHVESGHWEGQVGWHFNLKSLAK